jgi:RHS repeat-associated protein
MRFRLEKDLAPGASVIWILARPRRHHGRCIAREKECDRGAGNGRAGGFPPRMSVRHRIVHVPPAQLSRMRVHGLWGGLMRGSCRCGPRLRGYARFRALELRVVHALRCESRVKRAAQHSRALGRHGSSWPHICRPALSRTAGLCTVRRRHRRHVDERHASTPQILTFSGATPPLALSYGQKLIFYVLISECTPATKLVFQFRTTNGSWSQSYQWGPVANSRGPLPQGGVWTRVELSARELGIENRSIDGVAFSLYGSGARLWIDGIGKTGVECYPAAAASPAVPDDETVWIDDDPPSGSTTYTGTVWDDSQKASGARAFTRPPSIGDGVLAFNNASATLPITWGEKVVFYLLLNECAPPSRVLAQWDGGDGIPRNVVWGGSPGSGYVHMGPLPAAGTWARLEIPASLINLEGKSLKGVTFYVRDGHAWIDRVGKSGTGCYPAVAPQPTITDVETIWIDDAAPGGSTTFSGTTWDPAQKASGTQSFTRLPQAGDAVLAFANAASTFPVAIGETLIFYALINSCAPPARIGAQWVTTDGIQHNAVWGVPLNGYVSMGPVPAGDSWVRMEVPASTIGLEGLSINGVAFYVNSGQAWIDRVGKRGVGCTPATAAAPSLQEGDTVWIDDDAPDGASVYFGTTWDTSQKASGSRSITVQNGQSTIAFTNWTTPVSVAFGESVVFYALLNECTSLTSIVAQWVTTDGVQHDALWGAPVTGYTRIGDLPVPGTWTRLEVPASILAMEGQAVRGIAFYLSGGGKAWIDRVGKAGPACYPVIAPPPSASTAETVWIDDAPPAGASVYTGTIWDTSQKASGVQSFTNAPSRSVLAFTNMADPPAISAGDSLTYYLLMNSCSAPLSVVAQWVTTDGVSHYALWGEAQAGYTRVGPLPNGGTWSRIEIPASALGMENKAVKDVAFYLVGGGQVWIDRVGKIGSSESSRKTPTAALANGSAPEGWRSQLRGLFARRSTPVALSVSASYVQATSTAQVQRHSLYSPELQLLAESEVAAAATPAVKYEYVSFARQPLAQIETSTGAIDYYFNDHLGTPIVQTDEAGTVTWRAEYEPYGTVYALRAGDDKHQPLRFPGQETDGVTDESYNIFRWYRAGWGRFTQADPIRALRHLQPYSYARFNPLRYVDVFGLQAAPVAAAQVCCDGQGGFLMCSDVRYDEPLLNDCILVHEFDHMDFLQQFAPQACCGKERGETSIVPPELQPALECRGWAKEYRCLRENRWQASNTAAVDSRMMQLFTEASRRFDCGVYDW